MKRVALILLLSLLSAAEAHAVAKYIVMPSRWSYTGPGGFTAGGFATSQAGLVVPALDQQKGGCFETNVGDFGPAQTIAIAWETTNTDATNKNVRFRVKMSAYLDGAWRGTMDPSAAGANADCTASGIPYACCSGSGTGSSAGLCAVGTVQSTVDVDDANDGGLANIQRITSFSTPVSLLNVLSNANCSGTTCEFAPMRVCIERVTPASNELPGGATVLITAVWLD